MKQTTISKKTSITGRGIHTGVSTKITLQPAKANSGISFIRCDLPKNPIIKANLENLYSTKRSTNLKSKNAEIRTVEHLLAAIIGANIDNINIEVDNIEIPILDGSAKKFSEIIENAGITNLDEEREFFEIKKEVTFTPEGSDSTFIATPSNKYELNVTIDYNSKVIGIQHAILESINNFKTKISPARTFCFFHELEVLVKKNLIKGGEIDNAIVIIEKEISKEKLDNLKLIFKKKNIKKTDLGILDNVKLRFENEPARHKLLDLIGDLSLLGKQIKGKIHATKPGHKNNIKFAKYLQNIIKTKNGL
tara:strand:+ start:11713 stop:12633 length:921 start_codon:yes stop_codon:yes gene_type:complete